MTQLTTMTGRAVRLDDVDLNLFTGREALIGAGGVTAGRLTGLDAPAADTGDGRVDFSVGP